MKTSTVTPSFYYVFNISLYCNDTIPSFIGNLWRVLLLGNHLKAGFHMITDDRRSQKVLRSPKIIWKHTSAIVYDPAIVIAEDRTMFYLLRLSAINCDWAIIPANIKVANKDAKIYAGRSTTLHKLLFCTHTLCMNYVPNTSLLVSSSERSKQLLCFVHGQGQKTEQ